MSETSDDNDTAQDPVDDGRRRQCWKRRHRRRSRVFGASRGRSFVLSDVTDALTQWSFVTSMDLTTSQGALPVDERHLLLLGLLMAQSQHGYSINEFIERNLGRVSRMKRATAYALLERLQRKGLARMDTETVGNYPPRKVYSITPAGREAFFTLLEELLLDTEQGSSGAEIALMFVDWLERKRVLTLLKQRAERLRALTAQLRAMPNHKDAPGVEYAVQRKLALLQAEQEWLAQVVARLESAAEERAGSNATESPSRGPSANDEA